MTPSSTRVDIRPFHISIAAAAELTELEHRLQRTRWPSRVDEESWATGMSRSFLRSLTEYWMPSAIRLYWENRRRPMRFRADERVTVPVAVAHFPMGIPMPPRHYVERGYNVTRWTEMTCGGHFAALEDPEALADDICMFARRFR